MTRIPPSQQLDQMVHELRHQQDGTEQQSINGTEETTFENLSLANDVVISSKVTVSGTLYVSGEVRFEGEGEILQGENFNLEVGVGALPGLGCVSGDVRLTGGGWIESEPGAYLPDPDASGKANFELSIHCDDDGSLPSGDVSFNIVPLSFEATALDSMVVLGDRAVVAGLGEVNEDAGYGFALEAIAGDPGNSGAPNKLRAVVWHVGSGETIYDSDVGDDDPTATAEGNITLHQKKASGPPGRN